MTERTPGHNSHPTLRGDSHFITSKVFFYLHFFVSLLW